ncbi:MAG: aspartate ammonia-lyase [Lachnospiraceae bacterium]|uniref:aspartate ammonia-lyase n=1 Tax=Candidatus Weimeria bifida TaxID=2599074 RepID=A0A6N7J373_9FIRM|nr:aspartate ammonia-lyase [Candidatus Weimeria bifida]RRF96831.1 MAG: aspartate ammonia-lyase [Lachnospiraceae bacterium]
MLKTRLESDSIGSMMIPASVYYGVQSLRANRNFQITGQQMNDDFLRNLALIKKAAAITNAITGDLDADKANAIEQACDEVIAGKLRKDFILDPVQGGAGTSANMNMNEVIAHRASEILSGDKDKYIVHPNDDVNMGQSTNDTIPTAGKMTVLTLAKPMLAELTRLYKALDKKADEFKDVIKMGRTQLQDAVPMTLGDTFHAYATMVKRAIKRIEDSLDEMKAVNLGGTAIGSCINASDYYVKHVVTVLSKVSDLPLTQANDLFDATSDIDSFVAVSGAIKAGMMAISKMCNDLRLLSSGPRCGLHEINLPAKQNGSSIMPGKVNPVIPEVVNQVAFLVAGHDATIMMAAEAGQMELNAFEPVTFYQLFESITAVTGAIRTLINNCILDLTANKDHCLSLAEHSTGIATALSPKVGYQKAASIAKAALHNGTSVREEAEKTGLFSTAELDSMLDLSKAVGRRTAEARVAVM